MPPQTTPDNWSPTSWKSRPAEQQAVYRDPDAVERMVEEIARLPPIVVSWEVESLRREIAEAQQGKRFLLQGGDCAETFDDCESGQIAQKLKILLQMSLVLLHGLKKPVIRVGRFAGQYAKPRSSNTEIRDGVELPAYRGDIVNGPEFTAEAREPDPARLMSGYARSSLTLNFIRALVDGGFADLHHPEYWDLDFVTHSPLRDEYRRIADSISDSLDFFEAMSGSRVHETSRAPFYASHEALHLHYEQAQTRFIERQQRWYDLSTHMPWIGMRTAALDGAHVEFCRGISNPVGVKIGPTMDAEWIAGLCQVLNPNRTPGRLVLIHRMGANSIAESLPSLIKNVQDTEIPVLWVCDPMHGNTETTRAGVKTRQFDNIVRELEDAFRIHREMNSYLGGVHFELTGEDVTECTGGARGLVDGDLGRAYRSQVDPRLNYEQSLELAMRIAAYARSS